MNTYERKSVMKWKAMILLASALTLAASSMVLGAYHHEGERDASKFLEAYPDKAGTKLDHCALCHSGGSYVDYKERTVSLGSCQWCHHSYGYDGAGDVADTMNAYGNAYKTAGRNAAAITAIDGDDADGDGYTNGAEITATRFPGNDEDHPGLVAAAYRIYTKEQLMDLMSHEQFMLMNTSRSGDFYATYTGVPMKDLLDDAGILESATGITVYAPDGWSQYHPLAYDASLDMYHVYGNTPEESYQYPPAAYYYDLEADEEENPTDGWCDYSAPSCVGRTHLDPIFVNSGLKAILAYAREGSALDTGVLTDENKLDGEGPFRVVVPQKYVNPPDQSSKADNQDVIWPNNWDWDHNAGSCTRSVTIIRVEPLPEGMTDIDVLEAGWGYVDQAKVIVYGAIDGTDSNGNGILDSEEGADDSKDYDADGVPDYQDSDTACLMHAQGTDRLTMHTSAGSFNSLSALSDDDPAVPQANKPSLEFPYGVVDFKVSGLTPGATITVNLVFPDDVPLDAVYYKITADNGWQAISHGSNDGDNTISLELTDGDPATDSDGQADGTICDPGALALAADTDGGGDSGGSDSDLCFIGSIH
jgi:hypothetical protein